jgi:hypothetical protein
MRVSIARLVRLSGATDDGTDHGPLAQAARRLGADVTTSSGGSLRDLLAYTQEGFPVIVGWWSRDPGQSAFDPKWTLAQRLEGDCGHYSVVCGVTKNRVWLMDPQWTRDGTRIVGRRSFSVKSFLRNWYDTDTSRYRRVDRWYMVARFSRPT